MLDEPREHIAENEARHPLPPPLSNNEACSYAIPSIKRVSRSQAPVCIHNRVFSTCSREEEHKECLCRAW